MEYEPGETSVLELLHAVGETQKYKAALEAPVETSLRDALGTWTANTDRPSYAPGSKGRILLRIALRPEARPQELRAAWAADAGLGLQPGPAAGEGDAATHLFFTDFVVPADPGTNELLVRATVDYADPGGARRATLATVIPIVE